MTSSFSIASRAVLAVLLMIGFYLLALAIAFGLLWLVYAEVIYAHRLHAKLAIFCVLGAAAILWSVLPRFDRFEAPGPLLTRVQQPRLFSEIESLARSVGQAMPAEVYLVPDVNAWVGQRGGLMGFASRRVMGLGLPLLRTLSRSQLRAVLAHEFGHYHGGDTRLGPWVYKTRSAIGRTLASLGGANGQGSILQLPFLGYGKMFLRITHAVSRHQEFVADTLAARAVGSGPLIEGLRVVHGVAPAFAAYWANECAPVLNAGFRPPLAEGFAQFLRTDSIAAIIRQRVAEEMASGKADPYDTHPPLKERIEVVAPLPAGDVPADEPSALSLVDDVPELEARMLARLGGSENTDKLKPVRWEDVGAQVYLPQWRGLVKANTRSLDGLTPESLPACARDLAAFGKRFVFASGEAVDNEHAEGIAAAVVGAALAVLLIDRGAALDAAPGHTVSVTVGSSKLEPFGLVGALATGKTTADAWQQQSAALGLAGLDLGKAARSIL